MKKGILCILWVVLLYASLMWSAMIALHVGKDMNAPARVILLLTGFGLACCVMFPLFFRLRDMKP